MWYSTVKYKANYLSPIIQQVMHSKTDARYCILRQVSDFSLETQFCSTDLNMFSSPVCQFYQYLVNTNTLTNSVLSHALPYQKIVYAYSS